MCLKQKALTEILHHEFFFSIMDLSYLEGNLPVYRTPWYQTWMGLGAQQCDSHYWILPPSPQSFCVQNNLQKIWEISIKCTREHQIQPQKCQKMEGTCNSSKTLTSTGEPLTFPGGLCSNYKNPVLAPVTLGGKKSFNLAASEKKCWPQLSKSRRGEGGRKGTEEGEQVYGIQTTVLSRLTLSGGRKRTEEHETWGNSQAVPGGPLFGGSDNPGDSGLKGFEECLECRWTGRNGPGRLGTGGALITWQKHGCIHPDSTRYGPFPMQTHVCSPHPK